MTLKCFWFFGVFFCEILTVISFITSTFA